MGVPGVEPGTSSLSVTRSNHLSYTPAGLKVIKKCGVKQAIKEKARRNTASLEHCRIVVRSSSCHIFQGADEHADPAAASEYVGRGFSLAPGTQQKCRDAAGRTNTSARSYDW